MDVLFGLEQRIGHLLGRLIAAREILAWAVLGALAAVVPAVWMWGFTVDDALISVRYACHLSAGLGWRYNAHGPSTDGVTPLPWPLILGVMARADPLVVLDRARALGLVLWGAVGTWLGCAIGRVPGAPVSARVAVLVTLSLSVPIAAYAVSGMETPLATALATGAVLVMRRPRLAAILAGLAASVRPELAPWACVLAAGLAIVAAEKSTRVAVAGLLALVPFTACAIVRAVAWGRPGPLALMAKPSDLAHGLAYAGAACVVTLLPGLVLAPLALRREPRALAIVLAAIAHVGSIAAVGGDWMPYARLMVPVAPSLAYAAALLGAHARPVATAVRACGAIALGIVLVARGGTEGRHVGPDREALALGARSLLLDARRVAALDIGWLGAATDADIVDLAGVTDPAVAALPGGHTSKRIDAMFLLSYEPDTLVLYLSGGLPDEGLGAWQKARYSRNVEARLASDAVIARRFAPAAWLPLGARGSGYVLLRAR